MVISTIDIHDDFAFELDALAGGCESFSDFGFFVVAVRAAF